jgi:hypothetical protein
MVHAENNDSGIPNFQLDNRFGRDHHSLAHLSKFTLSAAGSRLSRAPRPALIFIPLHRVFTCIQNRFKLGQRLFPPHSVDLDVSDQAYVVVKRLPARGGEFEYQIKSLDEPHQQRVVRESQLKPNPWPKFTRRPTAH